VKISQSVVLNSGRQISSSVFCRAFRADLDPVLKFQLVLGGPGRATFRVVLPAGVSAGAMERGIEETASREYGGEIKVALAIDESLPAGVGGKFARVVREDLRQQEPGTPSSGVPGRRV
jgi:hypothetical protein